MNKLLLAVAIWASSLPLWLAQRAASDLPRRVDAGGHQLRLCVEGSGSPTVVLEIGLGGALEEWAAVQPAVAEFTRVVAYDRIGAAHHQSQITGVEVARELRLALRNANLEPPFILVGQSFGGTYNRIFASLFPDEVAGLVLLDPSQEEFIAWMDRHHPDRQIQRKDVANWPEGAGIWATLEQLKTVGPLPDVPTIVVTGARPGNDPLRRSVLPRWVQSHAEWVRTRPQGRHILAHESGHGVHVEAPDVVVRQIRAVVEMARSAHANSSHADDAFGGSR